MTINVLHLYYDLLNLYGESGNVLALKNYFKNMNIKTNIKFSTITDNIILDNIDIIYIGCGTENNQKLALKHLIKYKKEIGSFIENNKYIICTGNSLELFGKIIKTENKNYKCLNIFDFETTIEPFRIVDEALFTTPLIKEKIIGFQNQNGVIKNINDNHFFEIIKGTGSYPKSQFEGIQYKNFYGTYLIGPLLVRNPYLLEYIGNKIIKEKKYKIKKANLKLEKEAHKNFLQIYYSDK